MARVEIPVPQNVPADLTRPSARYRRLSLLVSGCLVGFAAFYVGLLLLLFDDLYLTWVLFQKGLDQAGMGLFFAFAARGDHAPRDRRPDRSTP